MTENMPSSVRLGSRPSAFRTRSYSSGESPCSATTWGVIWDAVLDMSAPLAMERSIDNKMMAHPHPAQCRGRRTHPIPPHRKMGRVEESHVPLFDAAEGGGGGEIRSDEHTSELQSQ